MGLDACPLAVPDAGVTLSQLLLPNVDTAAVNDTGAVLLEIFLFGFAGDLYGQNIDVAFIDWIREEKTFGSIDELKGAMNDDVLRARTLLGRDPKAFPPI